MDQQREPRRRGNGRGSVEVLADGRARVRIVVDGRRRQVGPLWPDEATAKRKLEVWLAAQGDGYIDAPQETTVARYGTTWLERREIEGSKRRAKVKTIGAEYSIWRRHVASSALGLMPIASVTAADVETFARQLRDVRAASATIRGSGSKRRTVITDTKRRLSRSMQVHALRIVRQVLAQATADGLLAANPAADVNVAVGGQRPRDLSDDWLRDREIAQLLAWSAERRARRNCLTGCGCGSIRAPSTASSRPRPSAAIRSPTSCAKRSRARLIDTSPTSHRRSENARGASCFRPSNDERPPWQGIRLSPRS